MRRQTRNTGRGQGQKRYPFNLTCDEEERVADPLPKTIVKQSQQASYRTREQYLAAQQALYQALLERAHCPTTHPTIAFQHRLLLNNIDLPKLSADLETMLVFDTSLHAQISCLLEALFFPYGSDNNLLHDRVRNKISFPQVTGDEGRGNLFAAALKGGLSMFTIKSNLNLPYEQLYEYIIGKLVLNPLRYETPNFAFTYAYHSCNNYFIDDKNQVTTWCITDREQSGYLYREKIDGLTLNEWMQQYGGDEPVLVEILLQIIDALALAYERYNFQHHDLTGDNIIVRELSEAVNVPLSIWGEDNYALTYWIPQIVNFGDATAVINIDGEQLLLRPPTRVQESEMLDDIKRLITNLSFQVSEQGAIFACQQNLPNKRGSWEGLANMILQVYNYNPVLSGLAAGMILPLYIIGDTQRANSSGICRFYQRYFLDRLYHIQEYYDLLDLFQEGSLSEDMYTWVVDRLDEGELDVQPMIEGITQDLNSLMSRDVLDDSQVESDEERIEILDDAITNVTTVADYIYILHWYRRVVQPILKDRRQRINSFQDIIDRSHKYYQAIITRIDNFIRLLQSKLYVNDLPVSDSVPAFERLVFIAQLLPPVVEM